MRKWILRILAVLACLVLLLVGASAWTFKRWKNATARKFDAEVAGLSSVINTSRGPVEYAEIGRGRPILAIHGSPGGFDQMLRVFRVQYGDSGPDFRAIMPSRPGYLRTPLGVGRTPADQADAMAELLDSLHIPKVVVHGYSDGGPSALQFALRHPEQCAGLVLVSAVTKRIDSSDGPKLLGLLFRALPVDYFVWAFVGAEIRALEADTADRVPAAMMTALRESFIPAEPRRAGLMNDAAQDSVMPEWPLGEIRCPTLIIQGSADFLVPPDHARYAASLIPGARLVMVDGGDHFINVKHRHRLASLMTEFFAETDGR